MVGLVTGLDIYVSPTGSDTGTGSNAQPFRTLSQAQNAVRQQLQSALTADINIHVAQGVYSISSPLTLTDKDSGKNGFKVNWIGNGAVVSGGLKVTGWTQGNNGIYSASVPAGTLSRNLYVNGVASNYARPKINRKDFAYTSSGMTWTNQANDWLQSTSGIAGAEIRWISSFTDRYAMIRWVGDRQLSMVQFAW